MHAHDKCRGAHGCLDVRLSLSAEKHAIFLAIEYIPTGTPSPYDVPHLFANAQPPPLPAPLTERGSPAAVPDPSASMRLVGPSARPGVMQASGHSVGVHVSLDLQGETPGLAADLTYGDVGGWAGASDEDLLFSSDSINALINDDPARMYSLMDDATRDR